jgi:hypothetical protein
VKNRESKQRLSGGYKVSNIFRNIVFNSWFFINFQEKSRVFKVTGVIPEPGSTQA